MRAIKSTFLGSRQIKEHPRAVTTYDNVQNIVSVLSAIGISNYPGNISLTNSWINLEHPDDYSSWSHWPLTRYVKLRVAHALGMPGPFSPPPRVSDRDMHHGTCVTHLSWCMPGSLSSAILWYRCGGNVPGIPSACAIRNFTYLVRGSCWWQ